MSFLTASDFLVGAVLPAVVVTVLCFIIGGRKDPLRARIQALIWACGFAFSLYFLSMQFGFPPHDAREGLAWSALALAFFVIVSPHEMATRYMLRAVFVIGVGLLAFWPIHESLT